MLQHLLTCRWFVQKLWLMLFFAFILLHIQVFGQDTHVQREKISRLDTVNLKKDEFRLSKDEFLIYYGFSDTAKAVINLYFTKRKGAKIISYSNLGFLSIIRAAGQEDQSPLEPSSEVTYKPMGSTSLSCSRNSGCIFII